MNKLFNASTTRLPASLLTIALALSLGACSGMSRHERNVAVGTAVGGVVGAVATGGSTVGAVGGAVVGGVITNEIDKKK
jgi:osmotically inducible lipoprotein OsmB